MLVPDRLDKIPTRIQNPWEVSSTKPRRREATGRVERQDNTHDKGQAGTLPTRRPAPPVKVAAEARGQTFSAIDRVPRPPPKLLLNHKGNPPAPVGKQHLNPSQSDTHNWLH